MKHTNRIFYIDTIKVFLTCLVVAHHAGQAYGPTGGVWVTSDNAKAAWLGNFFFINASYMMGLYFFISGYFLEFSLRRKTKRQFVKDRLLRLGIPLLFFTFFVFLPFNYAGAAPGTGIVAFFIDTYFNKPPIATGHLWFVASLLVYSFIYLLLFYTRRNNSTSLEPEKLRISHILAYIVLLTFSTALVRLYYPIDTWRTWLVPVEVAHIPQYMSLFFLGILFNRFQWLDRFKLSHGIGFLSLALAAYTLNAIMPEDVKNYWLTESFVESLLCVGISMGLLTVFRHYCNKTNAVMQLLSENAYGIYLFHVLIVIALQESMLGWMATGSLKFLAVTVLGIAFSLALSILLRKNQFIRKVI